MLSCDQKKSEVVHVDIKKYDFIDSTEYQPEKKVFVGVYSNHEYRVTIEVLQHSDNQFKIIQTIGPLESQFGNTKPDFEDYNQDGLPDLKLKYGSGLRGANTLFRLFVQDTTSRLIYIKGSEAISNLEFDIERQVVTGTFYYSGISFVDFKFLTDSLIETSGVDVLADSVWTYREYYIIDSLGKKTIVRKDSVKDGGEGGFTRDK